MTTIDRKAEIDAEREEDDAAAELEKSYGKLHSNIVQRIQLGKTPDEVIDWLDGFYDWPEYADIRTTCVKAIKSIYRHELTKAQEALKKAGTQ